MEKIFLKPTSKEILLKDSNDKDGAIDLFSYNYDHDKSRRQLGNLYVVGNVSGGASSSSEDGLDVGYVINLVASLAKREYYANPDLTTKDAFTAALKKINGVVEEFFKKKDTKINIGIFAIAGDEIHISKLGKFKIVLSRNNENIDILNNLTLFNKEVTEEKEFSSIISGKIHENDRILAFYPSRTVTARERYLKDYLLKNDQDGFAAKLAAIKEEKADFACAALHINIEKGHEAAVEPRVQPRELKSETVAQLTADEVETESKEEASNEDEPSQKPAPAKPQPKIISPAEEIPRIIPSEFALGRKALPFSKHIRLIKNINFNPKSKAILAGGAVIILVVAFMTLKSVLFVSPTAKALTAAANQAESNLKLAQTKISQNDLVGAHALLASTLVDINNAEQQNGTSSKADSAKDNVVNAMDKLDGAVNATLTNAGTIPDNSGNATLLTASGNNLYVYLNQDNGGALAEISSGSFGQTYAVSGLTPNQLYADDTHVVAMDLNQKKLASLSVNNGKISNSDLATPDTLSAATLFSDNLYSIDGSGILKVNDAALGKTDVTPWLKSGTALSDGSTLIAVDGNAYVLSANGTLTTYYLGKQSAQVSTPLAASSDQLFLTNADGQNLYLINVQLGRIYALDKKTGTLIKTYKVNAQAAIQGAAVTDDGTIYILSNNKIWKVQ